MSQIIAFPYKLRPLYDKGLPLRSEQSGVVWYFNHELEELAAAVAKLAEELRVAGN